ncbi:kinase-like domain-containing protein [Xylaria bambusicola]|uniref:kinase-like domain-containing protein n=1 Tax=Xylaria bambusicola TaxID=326684 RepID=UPI00200754CB|nr:kinase-like domain-containing protein [Xylaria bambusicola]KAI0521406.1 kinase-like domain-containing protein [Xylaria bambusicola]
MDRLTEPPSPLYERIHEIEGAEDVEDYRPGGLHPVNMFDMLDGRFEVCHKLGSGGIATVWLCYEQKLREWRAVKINAASRSHDDSPEIKILEMLENDTAVLGLDSHVVMPLEIFWIEGPNGRHLCTVLPLLGPTLSDWRQMSLGTDASRINNVCYQLTKGLEFLHSRGICHGDFRPANVLMRLKGNGLDDIEPDELFTMLHFPDRGEVFTIEGERSPHAPKWIIEPLWWSELKWFISDDVAIVDFGEAFEKSSPPESLGIPDVYAAPEILYGGLPAGIGSDIWSLAYSILQIRAARSFDLVLNGPLRRMERFAGPIPPPFRRAAAEAVYNDEMRRYERYGRRDGVMCKPIPLEERLQSGGQNLTKLTGFETGNSGVRELEIELGWEIAEEVVISGSVDEEGNSEEWGVVHYHLPEAEVKALADLLSQLFKYQPSQRMGTADILKHPWFEKNSKKASEPAFIEVNDPTSAPATAAEVPVTDCQSILTQSVDELMGINTKTYAHR